MFLFFRSTRYYQRRSVSGPFANRQDCLFRFSFFSIFFHYRGCQWDKKNRHRGTSAFCPCSLSPFCTFTAQDSRHTSPNVILASHNSAHVRIISLEVILCICPYLHLYAIIDIVPLLICELFDVKREHSFQKGSKETLKFYVFQALVDTLGLGDPGYSFSESVTQKRCINEEIISVVRVNFR